MILRRYRGRKINGEITVFLALITSVLTGLIIVLIESARLQLIRMNVEALMDTGLTSCFGEYDRKLFDRYDLLFIDSSYRGQGEPGIEGVIDHLKQYMSANSDYSETDCLGDWYAESIIEAGSDKWELLSDGSGEVLKYQASRYIDEYGEIKYSDAIRTNKAAVDSISEIDLIGEWDAVLAAIDGYGMPIINPGKIVREMVLNEDDYLNSAHLSAVSISDLPSKRSLLSGNGAPDGNRKGNDEAFVEYIMQKAGCYTEYTDEQMLRAEIEYIINGQGSDRDNMSYVINRLLKIRESDNLSCLRADGGRMEAAGIKAEEVTALCLSDPEGMPDDTLTELVKESIVYAWAYAESAVDVGRLLSGGKCPVNKGSSDIVLGIDDLTDFVSFLNRPGGRGISYKEYLGVFLEDTDDGIRRLKCMDVIEGNCRIFYNDGLRVDGCVDYLKAAAGLESGYGYSHTITRERYYE
ncbi:MAG: hypothetical protein IK111_11590 [Lachnospiraceae bacterium]|nr:hypothetical protein [Lachnospiraceae bacterium]